MRGGEFGEIGFDVQLELCLELLSVFVGRGAVVAMVHPEHGNVRLNLCDEVEDDGFVGAKVGGDYGAATCLRDRPFYNVEGGLVTKGGVGLGDLFCCHGIS